MQPTQEPGLFRPDSQGKANEGSRENGSHPHFLPREKRILSSRVPEYVLIGHVTLDIVPPEISPKGFVIGGTVTYAGLTAQRLGLSVGIVTSVGPELDLASELPGITTVVVPSRRTTTFENTYQSSKRSQFLRARAEPIPLAAIPEEWRQAPIIHLAPLAAEIDPAITSAFDSSRSLLALTPQGWLRVWDEKGLVRRPNSEEAMAALDPVLDSLSAVILSDEDVTGDWKLLDHWASRLKMLVITQGAGGAILCRGEERSLVPAFSADELDPTGAGDVFAAAFLSYLSGRLSDGKTDQSQPDPILATAFANCVASFAIEGIGVTSLPSLESVLTRWASAGQGHSAAELRGIYRAGEGERA